MNNQGGQVAIGGKNVTNHVSTFNTPFQGKGKFLKRHQVLGKKIHIDH